ncbi:hypothetical protein BDW02DRAFT_344585 [Decorospora gaudefroyi]|uniref:Uncharacterized protein n=1 Tax=Decorospora gaudefroyi TaxID=184978 RepID=A0A6A5KD39_9PLEO|nr:hypothetical protein BDW02DRAFT_344585 [Decorospora gaudefroyi]
MYISQKNPFMLHSLTHLSVCKRSNTGDRHPCLPSSLSTVTQPLKFLPLVLSPTRDGAGGARKKPNPKKRSFSHNKSRASIPNLIYVRHFNCRPDPTYLHRYALSQNIISFGGGWWWMQMESMQPRPGMFAYRRKVKAYFWDISRLSRIYGLVLDGMMVKVMDPEWGCGWRTDRYIQRQYSKQSSGKRLLSLTQNNSLNK